MELVKVNERPQLKIVHHISDTLDQNRVTSDVHFMAANTEIITVDEMRKKHTIPVFFGAGEKRYHFPV